MTLVRGLFAARLGLAAGSPFALELQRLSLLEEELVVSAAGTPAGRSHIDACRFRPGVSQHQTGGLRVLGILLEIGITVEMTELVGRHMDAEPSLDCLLDLNRESPLVLSATTRGDEEISVRIGLDERQDMPPVPAQPSCHIVRNHGVE